MTDLLTRPPRAQTARTPTPSTPMRPLAWSAAASGLASAGGSLLICLAITLTGWFLADAGAHGRTTDALRVGADGWLLGHGARLTVSGTPIGIVPLGLTLLLALTAYRSGRWAGATSEPPEDDRAFALGALVHTGLYVVVTVITVVLADTATSGASTGRAILGALVVGGGCGTLGMAVGAERIDGLLQRIPPTALVVARSVAAIVTAVLAVSSLLTVLALLHHVNDAATVMSSLDIPTGDSLMYTLVGALVAPNAVLFGSAYLVGPGFAVGTGTTVSTSAVTLGPVPAFPLLAALPHDGTPSAWLIGLTVVPVLLAAVGVALVQRSHPCVAWDTGALRGLGAGIAAAVVLNLLVAFAGGPIGTGRMRDVGAPLGSMLLHAVALLALGGLLGGVLATWRQRRAGIEADEEPDDTDTGIDPATEDTAPVPLQRTPVHDTDTASDPGAERDPDDEPTAPIPLDSDSE